MTSVRQQVLFLWLSEPAMNSPVVAWAFYDGADGLRPLPSGDQPYPDALAALRDGWRVFQVSQQQAPVPGSEHVNAHLLNEFVLERLVDVDETDASRRDPTRSDEIRRALTRADAS